MNEQRIGRVEICAVGEGSWRLCDASLPENDPRRLVAYVEQEGDRVVVLWLRRVHTDAAFATLDQALEAADEVLALEERDRNRASRPVFIPHFPPPVRRRR